MKKKELNCLFIGQRTKQYADLTKMIKYIATFSSVNTSYVEPDEEKIKSAIRKIQRNGLVVIADNISFSLQLLSDLIWQYSHNVSVILLTEKTGSTSIKRPFDNTDVSKIYFKVGSRETNLLLENVLHSINEKSNFTQCKNLLTISEKRTKLLMDTSNIAIAYVSRNMHLYANSNYLDLYKVKSLKDIRSIPLHDFIKKDEHKIFDDYIQSNLQNKNSDHSIILTLQQLNGAQIRAKVVAFVALLDGKKCFQLWVYPIKNSNKNISTDLLLTRNSVSNRTIRTKNIRVSSEVVSNGPLQKIGSGSEPMKEKTGYKRQKVSSVKLLKKIIEMKYVNLKASRLTDMADRKLSKENYVLSLQIDANKRKKIDVLLSSATNDLQNNTHDLFWDQVTVALLFKSLVRKKVINSNLFISLNCSSINNDAFAKWLLDGLIKLGHKATRINLMISVGHKCNNEKISNKSFFKVLKRLNCKVTYEEFSTSKEALSQLKDHRPDYIKLSPSWLKLIDGNTQRELNLGSLIRQFESKQIKIIAPCSQSRNMNKVLSLSGASFCHGVL